MSEIKRIKILNLLGELPVSLEQYFSQESFHMLERGVLADYTSLDFILVANQAQALDISKDYNCSEHNIKLICFGPVKDVRSFLLANGKYCLNKNLVDHDLGKNVLDKVFFDSHSIHLTENYGESFPETKEIAITNHLSLGASLDHMSMDAFEAGYNLVSLRSYLDHAVYYLTYLKQANLAGLPFELEYAHNDEYFVVNIQSSVRNFYAEYLIDSFGEVNSDDPIKYLLGVMRRSCDYLDIVSLEQPGKIVFNAFWAKNKSEHHLSGLSFHNIKTVKQIQKQVEEELKNFTPEQEQEDLFAEKIIEIQNKMLPGGIGEIQNELAPDSALLQQVDILPQLMSDFDDAFVTEFPDGNLSDLEMEQLEEVLPKILSEEVLEQITAQDKEHLLEKLQKKEMIEAYELEVERAKDELENNADFREAVGDAVSEEMTQELLKNVDLGELEISLGTREDAGEETLNLDQKFSNQAEEFLAKDKTQQAGEELLDLGQMQNQSAEQTALDDPFATQPAAQEGGLPDFGASDPFATGDITPKAAVAADNSTEVAQPATQLPPGVQAIADPVTGEPILIQIDTQTGLPVAVEIDTNTGEVKPIASAQPSTTQAPVGPVTDQPVTDQPASEQLSTAQAPAEQPVAEQPQLNPKTGQPMMKMVDPKTGSEVHISMDPETGQAVSVDPSTGEPLAPVINQQVNINLGDENPKEAFQGNDWNVTNENINIQIDPATGLPAQQPNATPDFTPSSERVDAVMPELAGAQDTVVSDFQQPEQEVIQKISDTSLPEEETTTTVYDTLEDEEFATFIDGGIPEGKDPVHFITDMGMEDEAKPTLIFGGDSDEDEFITIVEGGEESADEFAAFLSSEDEALEEEVFRIGGELFGSEGDEKFIVSGDGTENEKNIQNMVAKNLAQNENLPSSVKGFIKENAGGEINKALNQFAQKNGTTPDKLSPEQLKRFQQTEVPQVMKQVVKDTQKVEEFKAKIAAAPAVKPSDIAQDKRLVKAHMEQVKESPFNQRQQVVKENSKTVPNKGPSESEIEAKIKAKFQKKMAEMHKQMAQMQKNANQSKPANREQSVQQALHETMKESFKESMAETATLPADQKQKKQEELVKGFAQTLKIPEEQVKTIVKDMDQKVTEKEKQVVKEKLQHQANSPAQTKSQDSSASSAVQATLMSKLKKIEEENKKLKENMNAMKLKRETEETVSKKVSEVKEKVNITDKDLVDKEAKEPFKVVIPEPEQKINEKERQSLLDKIKEGKNLTDDEKLKMATVFDSSENNIVEIKKQAERQVKKLQLEAEQQETIFKSEINKATKAIKAKELVLNKAKETMKSALTRKEEEIGGLKTQINNLSQKLTSDKSQVLESEVKNLSKDKENLVKMNDVYKQKLDNLSKTIKENEEKGESAQLSEENRNLKRAKMTLENKLEEYEKKVNQLEKSRQLNTDSDDKSKMEIRRSKEELSKAHTQIKTLKEQQKAMIAKMQQITTGKKDALEKEVEQHKQANNKLQTRLREMQLKLKNIDQDVKVIDENLLEKTIAKKYENKFKGTTKELEVTKNQNKQLQAKIKELSDRLSGASSKNKDGTQGPVGSPKEKRLEANVKKLNTELSKAKNETVEQKKEIMKARKESTALKNQLAALKRELTKSKKAA